MPVHGLLAVLMLVAMQGRCHGGVVAQDAIKVGTYNVRLSTGDRDTPNSWASRRSALVELVRNLGLDVFGMQEVLPEQASYFRGQLVDWAFTGDHRGLDRRSSEACPVFYRKTRFEALKAGTFWLSATPDVPGSKSWNSACPRICSFVVLRDRHSGKRFCFANAHADHRSAEARERGLSLVLERMGDFGGGVPIVFVGDHNCHENDAPAVKVASLLKDAIHASETTPEGPWRSFTGWKWRPREYAAAEALKLEAEGRNQSGETGSRIDFIYVSPAVRVLCYKTVADSRPGLPLYPSDHFPVVAEILLP